MPFDGSGNFSRLYSWQADRDNGIRILASKMDGEFDNFAAGMNVVFFRNGLVPMSGNLNMGQNYITGLGAGSVGALSVRFADDPNSGLYLNGYNKPTLVANGVSRLEANTAGISVTGTTTLSDHLLMTANKQVKIGTAPVIGGDGGTNTYLYTGTSGLTFRNAADSATLGSVSNTGLWQVYNTAGDEKIRMIGTSPFISAYDATNTTRLGYLQITSASTFIDAPTRTALYVNGIERLGASSSGVGVTGALNATGTLSQAGNAVWHSGNFTPGNYAQLSGAAFTGNIGITAPSPQLNLTTTGYGGSYRTGIGQGTDAVGFVQLGNNGTNYIVAGNTAAGGALNIVVNNTNTMPAVPNGTTALSIANTGAVNAPVSLSVAGNAVYHAGNFTPGNYALLTGAAFSGNVSAPLHVGTGTEGFRVASTQPFMTFYNAAQSTRFGYIQHTGAGAALVIANEQNAGITFAANGINVATIGVGGGFNTSGAITQNGSQVWHAGNFNPANYAALSGAAFTGAVSFAQNVTLSANRQVLSGTAPLIAGDGGTSAYHYSGSVGLYFRNAADSATIATLTNAGAFNAVGAITQNGQQVWHAGNLTPGNYLPLTGGTLTGQLVSQYTNESRWVMNNGGTNAVYQTFGNTGGSYYFGVDDSTGVRLVTVSGESPYAFSMVAGSARALIFGTSNTARALFNSAGTAFRPATSGGLDLGTSSFPWNNLYANAATLGAATKSSGGSFMYHATAGLSGSHTRGTAAPSGGSDGDTYFQYS